MDGNQDAHTFSSQNRKLKPRQSTYFLTRILFLRSLAAIYFVAFTVAYNQNEGLLGDNGLLPATKYFQRLKRHVESASYSSSNSLSPSTYFQQFPTLLWFLDLEGQYVSNYLEQFALMGMTLSLLVFIHGRSNAVGMISLWILYFSIDTLGQQWYSFGWESQLLETGFIAIFLVPILSLQFSEDTTTTTNGHFHMKIAIYAYWWLTFRIMIGAGLIKIRGDQCWKDLTCMDYHYETQPIPNPLSYYLHHNFKSFHRLETMVNHVVELVLPWFMFFGRRLRLINGMAQILFQIILILSGNLSFLNWLTILPNLAFFDDEFLLYHFSSIWSNSNRTMVKQYWFLQEQPKPNDNTQSQNQSTSYLQKLITLVQYIKSISFAVLILYLSIPVTKNLLALDGHQAMNRSFQSFKLVNTYGAFGSITKKRTEVILQGTHDDVYSPIYQADPSKITWYEYEFKCKPGNVNKRPCFISPYHYRLDWLMWFAAFGKYQQHPWLLHLTAKLLSKQSSHQNNKAVLDLIAYNPFNSTDPPKFIRAEHYEYIFTMPFSSSLLLSSFIDSSSSKSWWTRKRIGSYFPPIHLQNPSFQQFGRQLGFDFPKE